MLLLFLNFPGKAGGSGVGKINRRFQNIQGMERTEIVRQARNVHDRYSLLVLLNRLKRDDLGRRAYPFTIAQLNHFCHPARNAANYVGFTIPKKTGGVRGISAPRGMLKSLLKYANVLLQALYEPTSAAMGFVPGRSVVDNAHRHVGMNYVLNLDLEDFFHGIPQARVWGALQSRTIGLGREAANALAGLCCTEMTFFEGKPVLSSEALPEGAVTEKRCVLPQGSPASPVLTNIVCLNLDRKLSGLARRFNVNYTRYADDITFSSMHNVYQEGGEFLTELWRIIAEQNFRINERKTRLLNKGERQEVTGLVVNGKVNVTREYARGIGSLLYVWERYGYNAAYTSFLRHYNLRLCRWRIPPMESVLRGRLQYLRMVKGINDAVYIRLKTRFEKLSARKRKRFSDINYVAWFTMDDFEKGFSTEVYFSSRYPMSSYAKEKNPCYLAACRVDGQEVSMIVSRSCRKKMDEAVLSGGMAALESVKKSFYVALCQEYGSPYWMVMKSRPQEVYATTKRRKLYETAVSALGEEDVVKDFMNAGFEPDFKRVDLSGDSHSHYFFLCNAKEPTLL